MTGALVGVGVLLAVAVIAVITHLVVTASQVTPWTERDQAKATSKPKGGSGGDAEH